MTVLDWAVRRLDGDRDVNAAVAELQKQAKAVAGNDLGRPEAMLLIQAHSLDAIFNDLCYRAKLNMGEYPEAFERYMRLAFKAQSQCKSTLEALAEIKNPKPVAFVKQANISNGPQQVNNGVQVGDTARIARAGEIETSPNKLLEQTHGERMDAGASITAVGADPAMAALEEGDGPPDARREGRG